MTKKRTIKRGDCVASKGASLAWAFSYGKVVKVSGNIATVDTMPDWHPRTKPRSAYKKFGVTVLRRVACRR